ncbi:MULTISPECIES: HAD family hydrolase [Mesoflavibacter]|uniref:HAD family hydrolase n=1 Tax=Mesoflavibacter profundi TaxID=2708110 RepID=A0ABT4RXF3_9FLAO|nr:MULTISPECIES: HAD family hydrolase [Mesoflavibacter]MDA0176502.1 HAD family hydrolase [Mesoflavibacter profundi]QIJ90139.1 Hydrolase, haloacid delahogenase-like family [Mesoflavibacter sp. HG96]QIJ92867.1 Hydrolase, haloacid delahogenase-like family [Mesoflavibacter sp. HG37]
MEINYDTIKVIGFDADDTLWVNETYFRDAEEEFAKLLSQFETPNKIDQELFKMEMKNLPTYGYGVKGFVLSMVEMAIELSNGTVSNSVITKILNIGKGMINKDVALLDGVEDVLQKLSNKYRLIVATKGDLLDQERKLEKSGLLDYFHHIEVLSDKKEANYSKLLNHLDIKPTEFLMIGNSLKSDILPLLNIKSKAIHVPFHTTWAHEEVTLEESKNKQFHTLKTLKQLPELLQC